jgi:hypothetical protein
MTDLQRSHPELRIASSRGLDGITGEIGQTTAATVWFVTGVGMACGAGLPLLALAVTVAYFVVAFVFPS